MVEQSADLVYPVINRIGVRLLIKCLRSRLKKLDMLIHQTLCDRRVCSHLLCRRNGRL